MNETEPTSSNSKSFIQKAASEEQPWVCSFEDAELVTLRRGAARSFRDNLIWLEKTSVFAKMLAEAPTIKHSGYPKILPK